MALFALYHASIVFLFHKLVRVLRGQFNKFKQRYTFLVDTFLLPKTMQSECTPSNKKGNPGAAFFVEF